MSANRPAIFDALVGRILLIVLVLGLLIGLYFLLFGQAAEVTSTATDSFSRSALGHRALVAFLESTGAPVLISRGGSAAKARDDVPLLVLEPPSDGSLARFELLLGTLVSRKVPAVVVLPKWRGEDDPANAGWIAQAQLLPARDVERVLDVIARSTGDAAELAAEPMGDAEAADKEAVDPEPPARGLIVRPAAIDGWRGSDHVPSLPRPQLANANLLEPLVAADRGILAGWLPETRILVIADPDLLNTAGLARAPNPALVDELLFGDLAARAFVVDEVLHGHGAEATLSHALTRFPFVTITLHTLVLGALVAWRVAGRFGRPLTPPSRLPPGKLTLIDNTARLLAAGEPGRATLLRYLELVLRRASRQAGLAPVPEAQRQAAALAGLARARGTTIDIETLTRRVTGPTSERGRLLPLAREIHAWYEELSDGRKRPARRR